MPRIWTTGLLVGSLLGPVSCQESDNSSGDAGPASSALEACEDVADAVAEAHERCGGDYYVKRGAFISAAAKGDCDNVDQIRDMVALYDQCIPSFAEATCDDLAAGAIDPACREQLVQLAGLHCEADTQPTGGSRYGACLDIDNYDSPSD